ncbi:AzlD domain-containing protein [Halovenus sp. WSH3]|uniref:AzlD domain-containing protein n=1 Tax=Halovenus carboxidivorans TaxID=2692199 RepID=A0A6B0T0K8_9EURY|nr:AzlD domain-containing protein [Halovenus carboxidivorans]MXR51375.1 AzlD domain-containing protein [Halovenus carboxidivorans]
MTSPDPVVWLAIVFAGVGTYALRASFLFLFERFGDVPDGVETALEMVPAAVLSALVVPAVVAPEGAIAVIGNGRVPAALVAAAVAWYTESILATILSGLVALIVLGAV